MLRKILVPIDFSEASMAALSEARELAQQVGAELLVLKALELPVMPRGDLPYALASPFEDVERSERERLAEHVEELRAAGVRARGVFHIGPASATILDCAREEQPDLIVIGSHGRRGLSWMILGSVAERVVRASPAPVLTIRRAKPKAA